MKQFKINFTDEEYNEILAIMNADALLLDCFEKKPNRTKTIKDAIHQLYLTRVSKTWELKKLTKKEINDRKRISEGKPRREEKIYKTKDGQVVASLVFGNKNFQKMLQN